METILYQPPEEGAGEAASPWVVPTTMRGRDPAERLYLLQRPGPWEAGSTAEPAYKSAGARNQTLVSCRVSPAPSTDKTERCASCQKNRYLEGPDPLSYIRP